MYISICVRLLIFCSNSKEGVKAITSLLHDVVFLYTSALEYVFVKSSRHSSVLQIL